MSRAAAEETWRSQLLEAICRQFKSDDPTHGVDHALATEETCLQILGEPEFTSLAMDEKSLRAAALLHDVGHSQAVPTWSSDRGEHIREGARIARDILGGLPPFSDEPGAVDRVCYLILNHDDTSYRFPVKTREFKVVSPAAPFEPGERQEALGDKAAVLSAMLSIIKEADSRQGVGKSGAMRTLEYSLRRNVPPFGEGNPLSTWMWEESAIGNIRLGAKRAVLDAFTARGREIALRLFAEAEGVVESFCKSNGVEYQPEIAAQSLHLWGCERRAGGPRITGFLPWHRLEQELKTITLNEDPDLFPYAAAKVETENVDVNKLSPLSRYCLASQVAFHRNFREQLIREYGLDLLDLAGILEYDDGNAIHVISPPIVEVYEEKSGSITGEVLALVDGIHRCILARELGFTQIRAVVIRNVPRHFPLVPLPLCWTEVSTVDQIPDEREKRKFRFENLGSFPDISGFSDKKVTEENYRYFFYRDLQPLGSSGIRRT